MRHLIVFIVFFCLFATLQPAYAANRALLIGVGKYQMKGINLPGIEKDVNMMRSVALSLGYEKKNIKVLLDEQATLKNIRKAINTWLVQGVNEDDKVLFYFSGHGTQIYDRNKDEPDKADEVLVTHDASLGVNTLNNVFVDDMFNEALEKIPSKNVFILIDACHSGTATRSIDNTGGNIVPKYLVYPGMPTPTRSSSLMDKSIENMGLVNYSALSAAQDNQRAQASNKGSFFTLGLKNAVDDASRGNRSLDMHSLHEKTTKYIDSQLSAQKKAHSPALVGNLTLNRKNLFIEKDPKPSPSPVETWLTQIKNISDKASYRVYTKTNGKVFKIGEPLTISCTVKNSGYLNIVTLQPGDVAPTVLFPNRFHPTNRVKAGQKVTIPGPDDSFELSASPPKGKAVIAVFHSPFPVNFYKEGYGDTPFKTMSKTSTRGFKVKKKPAPPVEESKPEPPPAPKPPRYGAAIVHVKIK